MSAQYPRELFDAARRSDECQRCNYDRHLCPGCGEPLPHGIEVCGQCQGEIKRGER